MKWGRVQSIEDKNNIFCCCFEIILKYRRMRIEKKSEAGGIACYWAPVQLTARVPVQYIQFDMVHNPWRPQTKSIRLCCARPSSCLLASPAKLKRNTPPERGISHIRPPRSPFLRRLPSPPRLGVHRCCDSFQLAPLY